jgi:hypothetical protein
MALSGGRNADCEPLIKILRERFACHETPGDLDFQPADPDRKEATTTKSAR